MTGFTFFRDTNLGVILKPGAVVSFREMERNEITRA